MRYKNDTWEDIYSGKRKFLSMKKAIGTDVGNTDNLLVSN